MTLNYDRDEDILMIETMHEGTIDHAEQTGSFIAHFSRDDQLLMLEILDATEFVSSLVKVAIRGQAQELPVAIGSR